MIEITNASIADAFEELADLLEFGGANSFRVRAYRQAANTVRDFPEPLHNRVANDPGGLVELPGIGKDLAAKIVGLVQGGHIAALEELRTKYPASVLSLLRVPGLGPKKAAMLHRELGIQDLTQLEAACREERIRGLKGFGAKTELAILDGLKFASTAGDRIRWDEADVLVQQCLQYLRAAPAVRRAEAAGSYRRGRDTVGDLDLLVDADDAAAVMNHMATFPLLQQEIARGDTKMSLRVRSGLQIDVRVVPRESFGAAWQYFTGSKEHNVELRGRAKQRGLKINEYGVYRVVGAEETWVAGTTEEEVYGTIGLPWMPPELREARQEFAWADAGTLPRLIELADLRGDLHMHTTESDGQGTLREMVAAAQARGLSYIAITDHSQRVSMARGLDGNRLRRQWREIEALNREVGDTFLVLKGVECDILEQGGMDLPDDVLAEADWVVASIHYGQNQPREQITDRLLGALHHPHVSAIAHPTGRLIQRRPPYEFDVDVVFRAAAEQGKYLELNANPQRLDLHDVHCALAKSLGIPIVINSDAHHPDGIDVLRYGIQQARRGGLTAADVLNTRATWTSSSLSGW